MGNTNGRSIVIAMGAAQGWYVDPFGIHQYRWISSGRPTALVRDAGVESSDPAPYGPLPAELRLELSPAGAAGRAPRDRWSAADILELLEPFDDLLP